MKKKELVVNRAYRDSKEKIAIDIDSLPRLKVEEIKINSRIVTCVRTSTDKLFRGDILDYPIIDIIVNDQYVEIRGLIVGKVYSKLILNLEYIDRTEHYLLEDFLVKNGDVISEYICTSYKLAFKRDITEAEFNEWYFNLQQDENAINSFIKSIVTDEEFLKLNEDFTEFIKILHVLIFRREIDEKTFEYWKNFYDSEIKNNNSPEDVKLDIISKMMHYKQFEYLIDKNSLLEEEIINKEEGKTE